MAQGRPVDRVHLRRRPTRPAFGDTYDLSRHRRRLRQPGHLLGRPGHHQRRLHHRRLHRHLPPRRHLRHRRRPGRQRRLHRRPDPHQTFDVSKATQTITFTSHPARLARVRRHLHRDRHRRRLRQPGHLLGRPGHHQRRLHPRRLHGHLPPCRHLRHRADQAGNDDYTRRHDRHPVRHRRARPRSRSPSPPRARSPAFGDTYTVTATGGDSGNPVTFSSTRPPPTAPAPCRRLHRHLPPCRHLRHRRRPGRQRDYTRRRDPSASPSPWPRPTQSITFTSQAPASPAFGDTYAVTATSGLGRPCHLLCRPGHHPQRLHAGRRRLHRHLQPCRHLRHRRRPGRQRRLHGRRDGQPDRHRRQGGPADHLHLDPADQPEARRHLRRHRDRRRLRQPGHLHHPAPPGSARSPARRSPSATPAPASSPPTRPATPTMQRGAHPDAVRRRAEGRADHHLHLEATRLTGVRRHLRRDRHRRRLRQPGHLLGRPGHHQQRLHHRRLHRHLPPRRHLRHRRRPGRQRRLHRRGHRAPRASRSPRRRRRSPSPRTPPASPRSATPTP